MKLISIVALATVAMAKMEVLHLDWYYRQCNALIVKNAALTASCKPPKSSAQGGRGRGRLTPKQLKCLCNLKDYRLSLFGCIDYAAHYGGTGENSIKESWEFMQEACEEYAKEKILDYETNKKAFTDAGITQTFREANQTKVGPFIPDEKSLSPDTCRVYAEAHWQGYWAQMFPLITTWYLAGILFVQAMIHWGSFFVPGLIRLLSNNPLSRTLRRHVVLPALFNKHRAAPMKVGKWFVLAFPPRLHIVFLTGYVALSITFLAVHFPWINDGKYWDSYAQMVGKYLAVRSGQLGMHKMVWLFLFAGRNNVLIWITGWQFEIFNHWHRWLARLFTVDILVHTIEYAIALRLRHRLPAEWSRTYMIWGFVAFAAIILLCVNGTKSVRQLAYETFLYVHIILAVFSVIGTYYHIAGEEGINELYAVIAVWGFDRVVRLARILESNPFSKGKLRAHDDGTLEIEINYSGLWKPKAGTYIFIYFVHPIYFFQSHPFTVIPLEEKGKMRLYCKALKGITKTMYDRTVKNGGTMESRLLIEGPYGVEFATKQFKEVVLFAGGIGVTAIYSHLKEIVKNGESQIVHIHWAISNEGPLSWFRKELEEMTAYSNVHVILHINATPTTSLTSSPSNETKSLPEKEGSVSDSTRSIAGASINMVNFAPDFDMIIRDHIANSEGDILFFVCGPAPMSDAVRQGVTKNLFTSKNYVQFFEESFSM